MRFDAHATEYSFDSVSGFGVERCVFLAYRRPAEHIVDPGRMESWLVRPSEDATVNGDRTIHMDLGLHGYATGAWLSPTGVTYVVTFDGALYVRAPGDDGAPGGWHRTDFGRDVELHGVWGIDDRDLYIWGRDTWRPLMWHLGRGAITAMPAPPGRTTIVRGVGPELLYAAGDGGFLARWDGSSWERMRLSLSRPVTGLCVADVDDLWITTDNGKLFEGTSHGWALRLQLDAPLYDVGRWRGALWIAGGRRGLFRLVDRRDELEPVAPDVGAVAIETRGDLLVLADDCLTVSSDGSDFRITCRDVLLAEREAEAPSWDP